VLTTEQHRVLGEYVTFVLGWLELGHWRIKLLDEPCDEDAGASIEVIYGQYLAQIKLQVGFFELPLAKMEHYLLHELCHLYSEGIDTVVRNGPDVIMGKPAYTMFYEAYRAQMELMTDQLAYVVHEFLEQIEGYRRVRTALKPFGPPTGRPVDLAAPRV
jgi:hypothetical protein